MLMSEFPVVSVHIPPALRAYADGREEVMASGETVGEILAAVAHSYPALGERLLCRDGALADGLRVYLGGHSLSTAAALATPVVQEETVSLVAVDEPNCPVGSGGNLRQEKHPAEQAAGGDISIGD